MNNDWIIWNGGDCPVSPDTKMQPQFRYQSRIYAEENEETRAGSLMWKHIRSDFDIIAYRIIPEPLWAKLTARVSDFGGVWAGGMDMIGHTHLLRIPMKLIDGKRVIDDSRQPVMEKL